MFDNVPADYYKNSSPSRFHRRPVCGLFLWLQRDCISELHLGSCFFLLKKKRKYTIGKNESNFQIIIGAPSLLWLWAATSVFWEPAYLCQAVNYPHYLKCKLHLAKPSPRLGCKYKQYFMYICTLEWIYVQEAKNSSPSVLKKWRRVWKCRYPMHRICSSQWFICSSHLSIRVYST